MRVTTDVGGTFTDLVYFTHDPATGAPVLHTAKSDTTPKAFERGVMNAIQKAGISPADFEFFAHGTTIVINALLSRRGAKTALITTKGFRDVLEIARGNRPDLFNFYFKKPPPFVPRALRLEITERVTHLGEVLTPAALDELPALVRKLKSEGVESIAVCFLHAYINPINESAVAERLHSLWPEISVIASNEVTREWREYERTSTTVLTAYVHPVAKRYLGRLQEELAGADFRGAPYIMQSNGGIETLEASTRNPISMVESGPASGVLGAIALGKLTGDRNMIALDVGGTTAKCSLIHDGSARVTTDYRIEWNRTNPGYPIKTPVIDIIEIGNGGGSIAWLDDGKRLRVGPQSAGADPGPAAYGRGGVKPTTTDAQLVCGRIDAGNLLGGEIRADMDNVARAFAPLIEHLGGTIDEVARGVIRIADANMVNALKLVSINRGYDPREYVLLAYGGGGAMHAAALAEELQIPTVVVPVNSSVFSAWGMLVTDLRRDYLRTRVTSLSENSIGTIAEIYGEMTKFAADQYRKDGLSEERIRLECFADMRYVGQEHTVKVELPEEAITKVALDTARIRFDEAHERAYTYRLPHEVQVVNFHVAAYGLVDKPELPRIKSAMGPVEAAIIGRRQVYFDGHDVLDTPIYSRAKLGAAAEFFGPAVVEETAATTVVPPGKRVQVDGFGNIRISLE
jgi:N-methylhydantoinase A